ncbi:MAG: polysaccharide pyruvyl transferase family protein [Rickettsiales bacterium]|nr:polysaccharide pyruvyl transferase family protein [Rickettsiales bacterium]
MISVSASILVSALIFQHCGRNQLRALKKLVSRKRIRSTALPYKLYYFNYIPNFGDALNLDLIDFMGQRYEIGNEETANIIGVGSLLQHFVSDQPVDINPKLETLHICGSGFIQARTEPGYFVRNVEVHALRGKLSLEIAENILGRKLPGVALGDPGLLLSRVFPADDAPKKYAVGIILHYVDRESQAFWNIKFKNLNFKIINISVRPKQVAKEISECEFILSSALHGLVAADSYGIPNRWIRLSDDIVGGDFKFKDYYSAFDIDTDDIKPVDLRKYEIFDEDIDVFKAVYKKRTKKIDEICKALIKTFPVFPDTSKK